MKYIFLIAFTSNLTALYASELPRRQDHFQAHPLHDSHLIENVIPLKPFTLTMSSVQNIALFERETAQSKLESYEATMNDGSKVAYLINYKGPMAGTLFVIKRGDSYRESKFYTGDLQDFVNLKVAYEKQKEQVQPYIQKLPNSRLAQ